MRRVGICLAVIVLAMAAVTAGAARTPPHRLAPGLTHQHRRVTRSRPVRALTTAAPVSAAAVSRENALGLDMLARLSPDANTVISPLSVETALAMVDAGASGQTAAQLNHLLGVRTASAAARADQALTQAVRHAVSADGPGGPTFRSVNGLWVGSTARLVPGFASALSQHFGAAPQPADFSDPTAALATINGWVAQQTQGRIATLMGPGQITAQTDLVLANAVYLNARWRRPFDANQTTPRTFHAPSGDVSAPFMNSGELSRYAYTSGPGYQAVALPYAHSDLQFLAVMPPAGKLGVLQTWLTPSRLSAIGSALRTQTVDLLMPKFTLSFRAQLNGLLQNLGVTRAFSAQSQLNRMVSGHSVAIQAIEHAAVLKVAEKGTVAAAATGVSVAPTAVAAQGLTLSLNRPFLVFLRDARTGTLLFSARVEDPAAG